MLLGRVLVLWLLPVRLLRLNRLGWLLPVLLLVDGCGGRLLHRLLVGHLRVLGWLFIGHLWLLVGRRGLSKALGLGGGRSAYEARCVDRAADYDEHSK